MHSRQSRHSLRPAAERRRHENVFHREGEYWTIAYDGVVLRLRDTKGLRYLACLLAQPGERMPAIELMEKAGEHGVRGLGGYGVKGNQTLTANTQHPNTLLSERARLAVTKRLKSAVCKIQEHHPRLGYHFSLTVKTGSRCVYLVDPMQPMAWTT